VAHRDERLLPGSALREGTPGWRRVASSVVCVGCASRHRHSKTYRRSDPQAPGKNQSRREDR
jgi:hypothetical protein